MQGIFEFIIQVKNPFQDTIETKSGHKFYVDPELDRVKYSNRLGKVISVPKAGETPIEEGDEVIIVQTVLMPHITQYGRSDSPFLVDKENGLYRVENSLIVMFRTPGGEWICNDNNVMIVPVEENKPPMISGIIIPESAREQSVKTGIIKYLNQELSDRGLRIGDEVYITPDLKYEFDVEGEKLWRLNNHHILFKKEELRRLLS